MTDTQPEILPAPEAAPARQPRRTPLPVPAVEPAPATETAAQPPTVAPVSDAAPVAASAEPAPEAPPAPARRGRQPAPETAITVPWETDLPGVRTSDIRAELARRERRAAALLAERERVVEELDAIEAALATIGD